MLIVTHSEPSTNPNCDPPSSEIGYGALIDTGNFNTYEYWDSCYWQVTDKNGTIYTFGASSTTKIVTAHVFSAP